MGGEGHSPASPWTAGRLSGAEASGGNGGLSLSVEGADGHIEIVDSHVQVMGGGGGDAPDGEVSTDNRTGGRGGGFSEGGTVSGRVCAGGHATMTLSATSVTLSGSRIDAIAGPGGDAGDGGGFGSTIGHGSGGGGYSGGQGANEAFGDAAPGGTVSGSVGSGGDASCELTAETLLHVRSDVLVEGGDGGRAGDGGDANGIGGGGGGGYSGGGGGGFYEHTSAPGGDVRENVGTGGDASLTLEANHLMSLTEGSVMAVAGDGGIAGDGGSCSVMRRTLGGAGGGGYSGGGGGGTGTLVRPLERQPGGDGGAVSGSVGTGGSSDVNILAPRTIIVGVDMDSQGGHGGMAGTAGLNRPSTDPGDWHAGGGGGGYSAGGGGGSEDYDLDAGDGGLGGPVTAGIADGGDARLWIESPAVTVDVNTTVLASTGDGGVAWNSSAPGRVGGSGVALYTSQGYGMLHVPMSVPMLTGPPDGFSDFVIPTFTWLPLHDSTTNGEVVEYIFEVSDDPEFHDRELPVNTRAAGYRPVSVPNATIYWRVKALYSRPWMIPSHWSEPSSFILLNKPPVISEIPPVEVLAGERLKVDLSPYIEDPDDPWRNLNVTSEHFSVVSHSTLNLTIRFPNQVGLFTVPFTVTDGVNDVEGELTVLVQSYKHVPLINGLGGYKPPFDLTIDEGESMDLIVEVHDVDSEHHDFRIVSAWSGITVDGNGIVHIASTRGDVGTHRATLFAEDPDGLTDGKEIKVTVVNVDDPPYPPIIVNPTNNTKLKEGDLVTFRAYVDDPDIEYGQSLEVHIISNLTGLIRTVRTNYEAKHTTSSLPVGHHRITFVVSDGRHHDSATVDLEVEGTPPDDPVTGPGTESPFEPFLLVVYIALLALGFILGRLKARRDARED
jgi:hypothetical protein